MGHAVSQEAFRKHLKIYWVIFGALLALTGATVAVGYLHFPVPVAVAVALVIASTKGTLVALYFMHLIDEKKVIYYTLGLTAVLFAFLMLIVFFKF